MNILKKLRMLGYSTEINGDVLRLRFTGHGFPDGAVVRPLLDELRARKAEALNYLRTVNGSGPQGGAYPGETTATVQPLSNASLAMVAATAHPLYRPGLPIGQQLEPVEEAWWAETFSERGIPDPAGSPPHEAVLLDRR